MKCEFCDLERVGPKDECGAVDDGVCTERGVFERIVDLLQRCDELGGLDSTAGYVRVMRAVSKEAAARADNAERNVSADDLRKAFEKRPAYRGWWFAYEHPGCFAYHHPECTMTIYFTPDWDGWGSVDLDAVTPEDIHIRGEVVPFMINRTPDTLFELVKPLLDEFAPEGF